MTDLLIHNGDQSLAVGVTGNTDGPPVLFLHGLSMCRDTWHEVIDALAPDYRCWTMDLRGHGYSSRASAYRFEDYLSDAEAAVRFIGHPPFVVGHSLGGAVAGALAQQCNVIRGALLEDPPWKLGRVAAAEQKAFDRRFEVTRLLVERLRRLDSPLDDYEAFLANMPTGGSIAGQHMSPRHILSRASALQRVDLAALQPVATVMASLDIDLPFTCPVTVLPAAHGAAFAVDHDDSLKTDGGAVEVLRHPNAEHTMHVQYETEAWFIDTLRRALAAALS